MADQARDRAFLIYTAKVYLRESIARRECQREFSWWLLNCAIVTTRSALRAASQRRLFA